MAKLQGTGAAYQCLYEKNCTLSEVMASLGLKPLSRKAERTIRDRLGFALAKWREPYSPVESKDIVRALNSHAKRLDSFVPLAAAAKGGFTGSHEIETASRWAQVLSENPTIGSIEAAYEYIADFGDRARLLASASRDAAIRMQSTKGQAGRSPYDWYDDFTAVMIDICKANNMEPKAGIDRSSGEPVGGLAKVASGFECLLLPKMRSGTSAAMVKRLQRSLARVQYGPSV
jgi:hypothetical protein